MTSQAEALATTRATAALAAEGRLLFRCQVLTTGAEGTAPALMISVERLPMGALRRQPARRAAAAASSSAVGVSDGTVGSGGLDGAPSALPERCPFSSSSSASSHLVGALDGAPPTPLRRYLVHAPEGLQRFAGEARTSGSERACARVHLSRSRARARACAAPTSRRHRTRAKCPFGQL